MEGRGTHFSLHFWLDDREDGYYERLNRRGLVLKFWRIREYLRGGDRGGG